MKRIYRWPGPGHALHGSMTQITLKLLISALLAVGALTVRPSLAMAVESASAFTSAEDPCYGLIIAVYSEPISEKVAKKFAAKVRKTHRLASIPPVARTTVGAPDKPVISFHRPIDYLCAAAISSEFALELGVTATPQAAYSGESANGQAIGVIQIIWPSANTSVIAETKSESL